MNVKKKLKRRTEGSGSWGRRCGSFSKGCILCNAQFFKLVTNRFPRDVEEVWEWQKSEVYINEQEENQWQDVFKQKEEVCIGITE